MRFCAILSEVKDEHLIKKFNNNRFLLEVWSDGELLYQRTLKKKVRVLNATRNANSIIYMLDKEDESQEGNFIHIVSLNNACLDGNGTKHKACDRDFHAITERKIKDWTGLCEKPENVDVMHFAIDKKNVLYLSVPGELHAVTLNDLVSSNDEVSINAARGLQGHGDTLTFGSKTSIGSIKFDSDFRLLVMYDTEKSSALSRSDNIVGIFDKGTILDFN